METKSLTIDYIRGVNRDERDSFSVVSWIGENDILSASGSDIVKWYTEEKGHAPADFYEALKWQAKSHESGNSYDILYATYEWGYCKIYTLSLSSIFPEG